MNSEKLWWGGLFLGWMVIGVWFSIPVVKRLGLMIEIDFLDKEQREEVFWGADYWGYEAIKKMTGEEEKIAFLMPHGYYLVKASYWLYPRKVMLLSKIEEIEELEDEVRVLFVFLPLDDNRGMINGLDFYAKDWKIERLAEVVNAKFDVNLTGEELVESAVLERGNLVFVRGER